MLDKLAELKRAAEEREEPIPGQMELADGSGSWIFVVEHFGAKGYAYLLNSGEMSWTVGNWVEPKSRPSMMVDIRAETLWAHGPAAVVDRVCSLIAAFDGEIVACKASRADLCLDLLMRETDWNCEIREHVVSQADHRAPYFSKKRRTGIQIGKNDIVGRLYDKPVEIIVNGGKKEWMFDIWGIDAVPDDHRIIRVEFEAKREGLKSLGIDTFDDLMRLSPNLWAYFTTQWLRLTDDPDKHHTRQKLLPWWPVVQGGFTKVQDATPAVRAKAVRADERQLCRQLLGQFTSLVALYRQGDLIEPGEVLDLESHLALVLHTLKRHGWDDVEFTERVKRKQAKFQRHAEKFAAAERARAAAGVSLKRPVTTSGK